MIYEDGKWYLYPSAGMAYVSEDFCTWKHVRITLYDCGYAPTVVKFRGKFLLTACGAPFYETAQGRHFGEQMAALANCWKEKFGGEDPQFIYTIPGKALAPKITAPTGIKGQNVALEIDDWDGSAKRVEEAIGKLP